MPQALDAIAVAVGADRIGLIRRTEADLSETGAITFRVLSCYYRNEHHCHRQTSELIAAVVKENAAKLLGGTGIGRTISEFSC